MSTLPRATTERFQPLRSGLLNLFKYQDQEFWFEKGRLLIRGNNGTGKSRVLALQLPFLFDGEISSRRVEPDGDPARQMAWHLLMDDQFEQRTGYTWIEFGRRDEQGDEFYLTLGCGMKAVKGGDNQPSRWYFITTQRIGAGLALQDGSTPRSAERMHEALREGDLFTKAVAEYRKEVNRRLFGMSGPAYEALIELLIRLRAPQLSKKLDEKALFAALSDALPPLAANVVNDVATAFKQLEDLRLQYQTLRDLQDALQQFRGSYQTYLQTLLLRRADDLTSRHSRYEKAHSQVTSLNQTIAAGEAQRAEAEVLAAGARDKLTACEAAYAALQSRPEATLITDLENAEQRAKEREIHSEQAQSRLGKAEERLVERLNELESQTSATDLIVAERRKLEQDALNVVAGTGFSGEHTETVPTGEKWPAEAKSLQILRQRHQIKAEDHLYRLEQIEAEQEKLNAAEEKLTAAQFRQDAANEKMEAERDRVRQHDEAAHAGLEVFSGAYHDWLRGLRWIQMPPWSELAADFEYWLETDVAEHRVFAGKLAAASRLESDAQAEARAALLTRQERVARDLALLRDEAAKLAEAPAAPLLPKVRVSAEANRASRPGAPLWKLCEFQPHMCDAHCAGLEAALEAAGLLDAWISPDGEMSVAGMPADTFLQIEVGVPAEARGSTLAEALCPDADSTAVSRDVLTAVLRQIGLGHSAGRHWVSVDGTWQMGPLRGRGEKPAAEFTGTRSREAARQRRLAEIAAEKDRLTGEQALLAGEEAALEARKVEAGTEVAAAPKDEEIARHLTLRTNARKLLNEAATRFDEAAREADAARQAAAGQREDFATLVKQLGYGAHLSRIGELRNAWNGYQLAMSELWAKAAACVTAAEHLDRARTSHQQAAETHANEAEITGKARTAAIEARQSFDTLKATVGISVSEYQAMVSQARKEMEDAARKVHDTRNELDRIEKHLIGLCHEIPGAEEKVREADTIREEAIRALRIIFNAGLFGEADERLAEADPQSWAPSRAVQIARNIARTLPDLEHDDSAWTQRLNLLDTRLNELRTRTGAGCPVESEQLSEGLTLITCVYQGARLRPAECLLAVERERETHDRLLAEEERKIIDQHLVAEVSEQLRQLIEQAQDRTRRINKEMEKCATTLGVAMKLVWESQADNQPPALPAVRKLLLMDHAAWTDEQRQTVGHFLHQLIKDERIKNPSASAAGQLLAALDYRRWHAFSAERLQNGRWERLTRKRYGTGSGGEKALMLTIPQMAAAASHYSSASSHAPRFILLDEAFAGMDKPTRGRCMGLLEAFDLDLMMTSEREHGAHASVSGIAIYQLVADTEAVAATRWVWNGSQTRLAPVPDTPELRAP